MNKQIYLDNAATTKAFPEVIKFYSALGNDLYGNPSSIHSLGEKIKNKINTAREQIASYMGVFPKTLFFTPGGTISNYIAIMGHICKGMKVVTCATEHPSVLYTIKHMQDVDYTVLPVDKNGVVSLEALEKNVGSNTCLVSIMHVNNETGVIQPLEDISRIIKSKNPDTIFHVDGIQGFGKIKIDIDKLQIDTYSISSHKINGHVGAAGIYIKDLYRFKTVISGGMQEGGVCPGTENALAICSFALASSQTFDFYEKNNSNILKLNERLRKGLLSLPYGVTINSPKFSSPYILNVSLKNREAKKIVTKLSEKNIYISSRSACHCKSPSPSYVLKEMGLSDEEALSAIRISFGYDNTISDIDELIEALKVC